MYLKSLSQSIQIKGLCLAQQSGLGLPPAIEFNSEISNEYHSNNGIGGVMVSMLTLVR
jgi:hypothetical protein